MPRSLFSRHPQVPAAIGRAALVALAASAALGTAAAGPVFTDTTMSLAQFSSQPLYLSAGTSVTALDGSANGHPAPALQVRTGGMTGSTDYGYMAGFLYSAFAYDPGSQGAVTSLDFSLDRAVDFQVNGNPVVGGITGRMLLQQGGQTYMAVSAPVAPPGNGFVAVVMNGLLASDFGLYDFSTNALDMSLNPDFAAGAMSFGFAVRGTANGWATTDVVQLDAYADNFRLAVHTAAVPVPATLALALLGLALLGLGPRPAGAGTRRV
jgi:hypothetical protein